MPNNINDSEELEFQLHIAIIELYLAINATILAVNASIPDAKAMIPVAFGKSHALTLFGMLLGRLPINLLTLKTPFRLSSSFRNIKINLFYILFCSIFVYQNIKTMNRGVTIWENEMTDEIDPKILSFIDLKLKGKEFKQLSALSHRDDEDIFDSLRESYYIVIQPNMMEREQIIKIAQLISHPIHINYHSNTREWDIQSFMFVSSNPWETLKEIKTALYDIKDRHSELCLMKILGACSVEFFNFDLSVHYELVTDGYWNTKAIRYK